MVIRIRTGIIETNPFTPSSFDGAKAYPNESHYAGDDFTGNEIPGIENIILIPIQSSRHILIRIIPLRNFKR